MTLSEIRRSAIEPALLLLPARMTSPQAEVLLLAIGLQESQFVHRRQLGGGPGRSYWQGELTGGMILVLDHEVTKKDARALCAARGVPATPRAVYAAIEHDDILAAGLARPGPPTGQRTTRRPWRPSHANPHERAEYGPCCRCTGTNPHGRVDKWDALGVALQQGADRASI